MHRKYLHFMQVFLTLVLFINCDSPREAMLRREAAAKELPVTIEGEANQEPKPTSQVDQPPLNNEQQDPADPMPNKEPMAPPTTIEQGSLNVQWIHGSANCNQDQNPPLQVHPYNKNFIIIRQNKCLDFEAPFIYLIFGEQKAVLFDTGATASAAAFPIRQTVENLMTERYGTQRAQIQLFVMHSHAHGDHIAGDQQFNGQMQTTLVGTSQAGVATFLGITDWPNQMADYDLGGRVLKAIPLPGHETSHIALYDAKTGLLLSGDTLYPGRLYIQNWEVYRASISRLRSFVESRTITHILGAHIEMSQTPGTDYPIGSTFQPNEHPIQLKKEDLILLDNELKSIGTQPMRKVLNSFIITP